MSDFVVTKTIDEDRVKDLLCTGIESAPYNDFVIVGYQDKAIAESCTYPHFEVPFEGSAVFMKDKYGDDPTVYELDRASLERGLNIMAEKYPRHFKDFLMENEDVITGTVFVQCCLLGKVIYG